MTILTISYFRHAAATDRLNALTDAYKDMPAARQAMTGNPAAFALINAASHFQAALRNKVSNGNSAIIREFGDAATTTPLKTNVFTAQLAIASDQPAVNLHLKELLTAHKNYLASQPKKELFMASRRLLSIIGLGR